MKNSNKNNKSKKLRQRPPKNKRVRTATFRRDDIELVCGLVDPFCDAAIGAKIPDTDSTLSLTQHVPTAAMVYTTDSVAAQSNGQAFVRANPSVQTPIQYAGASGWHGTSDGHIIGTALTDVSSGNDPLTTGAAEAWRTVSAGVVVYVNSNIQYTKGLVQVTIIPSEMGHTLTTSSDFDATTLQPYTRTYTLYQIQKQGGLYVPFTLENPNKWVQYANDTGAKQSGLSSVLIYAFGMTTGTELYVRTVQNFESKAGDSAYMYMATPAAQSQPTIMDNIQAAASSVLKSALDNPSITKIGHAAIDGAKRTLMGYASNVIGGSGAASLLIKGASLAF